MHPPISNRIKEAISDENKESRNKYIKLLYQLSAENFIQQQIFKSLVNEEMSKEDFKNALDKANQLKDSVFYQFIRIIGEKDNAFKGILTSQIYNLEDTDFS